jgi:nucleotide-binding universal stress UspA family protein
MTVGRGRGQVVVGYDGSPESAAAADWAGVEAARRGAPVTVLTVADPLGLHPAPFLPGLLESMRDSARGVAEEGAARVRKAAEAAVIPAATDVADVAEAPVTAAVAEAGADGGWDGDTGRGTGVGVEVTLRVADDVSPAAELVEASHGAQLLVLGTRGHGEVVGTLLGSVAFAVTAHAACPVVVVRGDDSRHPGPEHSVVVGVDGSASCLAAVRFAADLAASSHAPLVVVCAYRDVARHTGAPDETGHVLAAPGYGPTFAMLARETAVSAAAAARAEARAARPGIDVRLRVEEGRPSRVLARVAKGRALLVLGARGQGGFAGLRLGAVTHALVHTAPCPVAVVSAG